MGVLHSCRCCFTLMTCYDSLKTPKTWVIFKCHDTWITLKKCQTTLWRVYDTQHTPAKVMTGVLDFLSAAGLHFHRASLSYTLWTPNKCQCEIPTSELWNRIKLSVFVIHSKREGKPAVEAGPIFNTYTRNRAPFPTSVPWRRLIRVIGTDAGDASAERPGAGSGLGPESPESPWDVAANAI